MKKLIVWKENWEPARIRDLDTPCWDCISHADAGHGYKSIYRDGEHTKVHRFIYQELFGVLAKSMLVCHRCDNPACINPQHLFAGTHFDNAQDCLQKGRRPNGENTSKVKLTELLVREIISNPEKLSGAGLAKKYGMSHSVIYNILNNKSWKHISRINAPAWVKNNNKLSESQVANIRTDRRQLKIVGAEYGISRSMVSRIRNGTHWGIKGD